MPGRPLAAMQLLLRGGAAIESATENGTAALLARLLTEGGPQHDAIELVEAAELLGGSIGAEAGFEGISIDRKSTRLNSSHSQQSRMPSSA